MTGQGINFFNWMPIALKNIHFNMRSGDMNGPL
jgi:hypothetical protein